MNIVVSFQEVALSEEKEWREKYWDSLSEAQELLVETFIQEAKAYSIVSKQGACGYLIVSSSGVALEFYLDPEYWVFGGVIIAQAIKKLGVKKALVKSFDHLFFSSALDHQASTKIMGHLVRDFVSRELPRIARIAYASRVALQEDIPSLLGVQQEVFTNLARIEMVVGAGLAQVFETLEGDIVGFGIIRPVLVGRRDVDIAIAVDLSYRNKGYAIYMMRDLVRLAQERGFHPVAGCSVDNLASRRMGERIGLVSLYRLLEISFVEVDCVERR